MNYPKSLEKCPIIDALVEIRFLPKYDDVVIPGLLYPHIADRYGTFQKLPIADIPENLRKSDPNLSFKPIYKFSNDSFVVQVGPDVLTISSFPNYSGWDDFSEEIKFVLSKMIDLKLFDKVIQLGFRYINFFESDIFEKVKVEINIDGGFDYLKKTTLRTNHIEDVFNCSLHISSDVIFNDSQNGSIIDIELVTNQELEKLLYNDFSLIEKAHNIEKKMFFSLLKKDFLDSLKPVYNNE